MWSFGWCWQMRGLPINGIWRGQQHMTLAKTLQLPELAYWRFQGGALNMCSFVQKFSSSCSSDIDHQADTTSHQPLLVSSACSECNYVRSQFSLYHRRLYRPPAAVSKDGLEPGGGLSGVIQFFDQRSTTGRGVLGCRRVTQTEKQSDRQTDMATPWLNQWK